MASTVYLGAGIAWRRLALAAMALQMAMAAVNGWTWGSAIGWGCALGSAVLMLGLALRQHWVRAALAGWLPMLLLAAAAGLWAGRAQALASAPVGAALGLVGAAAACAVVLRRLRSPELRQALAA